MELENSLACLIIGDKDKKYDGKIIYSSPNMKYHINAINSIYATLLNSSYKIGNINTKDDSEACYDIICLGHILVKNVSVSGHKMYFLYVPNEMTTGQLKSLKSILEYFKEAEIYVCKVENDLLNYQLETNIEKNLRLM